jgi:hypothetical protein
VNARLLGFLLGCSALVLCASASAQQISNFEVGTASTTAFGSPISTTNSIGLVGRFTYNFTPSFSIDSEFGGFLTNENGLGLLSYSYGGRPFLALIGPKAGIRTRHVNLFFEARGGVLSYPTTYASLLSDAPPYVRKTYAALDVGFGVEIPTSSRTFLRVDVGELMFPVSGSSAPLGGSAGVSVGVFESATVQSPFHLEVGAGYRLGALRPPDKSLSPADNSSAAPRFTAGAQYSLMTLARGLSSEIETVSTPGQLPQALVFVDQNFVRSESAAGGFFTWNFSKYVGLDSGFLLFPRNMQFDTAQDGGRMLQAVGGIRAGLRLGRLGVFAKVRPGILTFTSTEQRVTGFPPYFVILSPFTNVALDAGGIIEYYASPRFTFRLDAGQTSLYYRERTVPLPASGESPEQFPAFWLNAMQVTVGIGYRFGFPGGNGGKH